MSERIIGTRIESHDKGSDIAISVSHLSKSFRLPTERSWGLKQAIFNRLRGIKGYRDQQVLSDISFDIKKGEFVGIVGRNGSGKSTLLKILAGVYYPSSGQVVVNGNLIPFIELGVGFNMELTGRENVYLNGAMLGFSNSEITAMYDDIVKFAELEDFMDQKLKNYSSGMRARLGFAIATIMEPDILILDEVLAVGDARFRRKCIRKLRKMFDKGTTVLFVSHSIEQIRKVCNRAILLEDGQLIADGDTDTVIRVYQKEIDIDEDDNDSNES